MLTIDPFKFSDDASPYEVASPWTDTVPLLVTVQNPFPSAVGAAAAVPTAPERCGSTAANGRATADSAPATTPLSSLTDWAAAAGPATQIININGARIPIANVLAKLARMLRINASASSPIAGDRNKGGRAIQRALSRGRVGIRLR